MKARALLLPPDLGERVIASAESAEGTVIFREHVGFLEDKEYGGNAVERVKVLRMTDHQEEVREPGSGFGEEGRVAELGQTWGSRERDRGDGKEQDR